jgi:hypothetical protein
MRKWSPNFNNIHGLSFILLLKLRKLTLSFNIVCEYLCIQYCYVRTFNSSSFLKGVKRCLSFWYHMYGADMGTLNVLVDGSSVWTRTGDQGNSWKKADITIEKTTNYKVKNMHSLCTETNVDAPYMYLVPVCFCARICQWSINCNNWNIIYSQRKMKTTSHEGFVNLALSCNVYIRRKVFVVPRDMSYSALLYKKHCGYIASDTAVGWLCCFDWSYVSTSLLFVESIMTRPYLTVRPSVMRPGNGLLLKKDLYQPSILS